MGVTPASATNMIKKLAARDLVLYEPYHAVRLTPAGEQLALEVLRHHRLVELFLCETLGMPWDQVHVEAHKLEHVLSDNVERYLTSFLGDPTEDPHGDPIPTESGTIGETIQVSLVDLAPGERATIRRVGLQDPPRLRYLQKLGLIPKASVTLIEQAPFDGPVHVRMDHGKEYSLDQALACQIWVSRGSA
jgi:DtxR family Mn-dependent transcriptional regulator